MTQEDFKKIKNKPFDMYVCIQKDSKTRTEREKSLKQVYDEFIRDADILKAETKGIINLYKTGGYVNTARYLFNHYAKNIETDPISDIEAEWLESANMGTDKFLSISPIYVPFSFFFLNLINKEKIPVWEPLH